MCKVSVIMPVYNGQEYLRESIDSVMRQTLQNWELLCVDDGSTDDSLAILRQYQMGDARVRIFTQQNQGAGEARNLALANSKGEYLAFLDADDYYQDTNALAHMIEQCEKHRVNVCGSCIQLLRAGTCISSTTYKSIKDEAKKRNVLHYGDFQFDYDYFGFVFKSSMLKEHNIRFPLYRRFQDPPFLVKAMYAADKFAFSDVTLYCYRVPVVATRFNKEKTKDLLRGLRENLVFAHEKKLEKLFYTTLMRIEYEYYSIICRYIDVSDQVGLGLLEAIQSIVRCELKKEDYVLRTLQFLNSEQKGYFETYESRLREEMLQVSRVYIYGAGGLARKFLNWLNANGLQEKVQGIIVSDKSDNQETVAGIEVKAVDELLSEQRRAPVYVAVGGAFQHEIVQGLKARNIENYHLVDSVFLEELEV